MILLETEKSATIDGLLRIDGKAELIGGRIVPMMSVEHTPNRVAGRIYASLLLFADRIQAGQPYTDGIGFSVPMPHSGRQSFSPDVSFYRSAPPRMKMRFVEGPPTFAVEVRSENDYGPAAEVGMAAKRADYFEAGTLVVWDVDADSKIIYCYRSSAPFAKEIFHASQWVSAEPAVPGWRINLDEVFRD